MVRIHFPQRFVGDEAINTNFPPQSAQIGAGGPPIETFNELIEEVALTFDDLLFEETSGVFGNVIIDETGRLLVYDNEVAQENPPPFFDNVVIEEMVSVFNNMAILETA